MAVFELDGALAAAIPELAVGPWTRTATGLFAFDATASPAAAASTASLWRVDLARDDAAARTALARGEDSVAATHAILDDLPRRLERVLAEMHASCDLAAPTGAANRPAPLETDASRLIAQRARGEHRLSHASGVDASRLAARGAGVDRAPPQLPAAESNLQAALAGADLPPLLEWPSWSIAGPGSDPAAASPAAEDPGRLAQALERIVDLARGRARIETRLEGALVAHSITTLSGDTELWIAPRLSPSSARLHARSVAAAVRTRHAWARILTLVVRGCGRLIALGLPAGGLAALPIVWRFVRDVLREIRDWRTGDHGERRDPVR